MKNVIFIIFFFCAENSNAQQYDFAWAKQTKGRGSSNLFTIQTDAAGNVYSVGGFTDTSDFDPGPSSFKLYTNRNTAAFVWKMDKYGNFIWAKQLTSMNATSASIASALSIDINGDLVIAGFFSGLIDFDPGPGTVSFQSNNATTDDGYILKLTSAGNFLWIKQLGASTCTSFTSNALATDNLGNIITTGVYSGTCDFDPGPGQVNLTTQASNVQNIFILKLNASGNFTWVKDIGRANAGCNTHTVKTDATGNIYCGGEFSNDPGSEIDFDPGPGIFTMTTIPGDQDMFLLKLNPQGNLVWVNSYNHGSPYDVCHSISIDGSGNIYGSGFTSRAGVWESFILKTSNSGVPIWYKQLDGTQKAAAFSIASTLSGQVFIVGYFAGEVDFDPGIAEYKLNAPGNSQLYIAAYDNNGGFKWAHQMGGPAQDFAYSVTLDRNENVFATGTFNGLVDFDPGAGAYNMYSAVQSDVFVMKFSKCLVTTSTVNINSCKNFQWNGQVYVESGQYYQTVLGSRGCDSTITLNFNVVILNSTIDTTICKGLNYYGHSTSGNYKDSFVTANGCDSVRNLKLTVVRLPNPELGPNVNLCKDEIITLNPGSFTTYLWQDGSQSPDYVVKDPGTYNVRVSNSCGSATDQVTVTANDCTLYFPSAFSPNNDGRNDLFKALTYNNLKDFHLMVYSRDGQKIFDSRNYTKGWNGKFEGQEMAAGVYAWYCEYKTPGQSGMKNAKGVVMLVR